MKVKKCFWALDPYNPMFSTPHVSSPSLLMLNAMGTVRHKMITDPLRQADKLLVECQVKLFHISYISASLNRRQMGSVCLNVPVLCI